MRRGFERLKTNQARVETQRFLINDIAQSHDLVRMGKRGLRKLKTNSVEKDRARKNYQLAETFHLRRQLHKFRSTSNRLHVTNSHLKNSINIADRQYKRTKFRRLRSNLRGIYNRNRVEQVHFRTADKHYLKSCLLRFARGCARERAKAVR